MSYKCHTLYCALILLGCLACFPASGQASEQARRTLQPLPLAQLRQSKEQRFPPELKPLDEEDINAFIEGKDDEHDDLEDEEVNDNDLAALNENDDDDLELADDGSLAEINRLIAKLEAMERQDLQQQGRASSGIDARAAPRRNRKRCGANKRNGRRGQAKRRNGQRKRNGQKAGNRQGNRVKRVQRP